MTNYLEGRCAVVTGARSGIGRAIAGALAKQSVKVVLASRNAHELQRVADQIGYDGGCVMAVPTDVTSERDVANLFERAVTCYGSVDILVNNAGTAVSKPTDELSLDEWQSVLNVNLTGAFLCSREALRIMKKQRHGRILNVGSISARVPRNNSAAYATSKSGLEGLTRSLALDARNFGIAVSVIHPGNTKTSFWERREEILDREGFMVASDVAQLIVTLLSLPDGINLFESVLIPIGQPFLGRG